MKKVRGNSLEYLQFQKRATWFSLGTFDVRLLVDIYNRMKWKG